MSSLFSKRPLTVLIIVGALFTGVAPAHAQFEVSGSFAAPGRDTLQGDSVPLERDSGVEGQAERERREWLLSVEAVTNAPVDLGARVTAEAPFGLRASTGFGIMPGAYLGLINSALSELGAYDDRTAGIVDGTFERGTVWRSQVGFRPFAGSGLYVDGGYALVRMSGSVTGADVAPWASDLVIDGMEVRDAAYQVDTTVHMWVIEVGYSARFVDHMVLGVGIGVVGTLSANSAAVANFEQGRSAGGNLLSRSATRTIDDTLETYGYVPTLTLRIGYDFL